MWRLNITIMELESLIWFTLIVYIPTPPPPFRIFRFNTPTVFIFATYPFISHTLGRQFRHLSIPLILPTLWRINLRPIELHPVWAAPLALQNCTDARGTRILSADWVGSERMDEGFGATKWRWRIAHVGGGGLRPHEGGLNYLAGDAGRHEWFCWYRLPKVTSLLPGQHRVETESSGSYLNHPPHSWTFWINNPVMAS